MFKGTIENWFADRGFGFIRPDDRNALPVEFSARNVFCHIHVVQRSGLELDFLNRGDRVQFEIVQRADGRYEAADIHLIGDDPAPVRYGMI